jgi:hypothetical protein
MEFLNILEAHAAIFNAPQKLQIKPITPHGAKTRLMSAIEIEASLIIKPGLM